MSSSDQPSAKLQKLACPINDLSDKLLRRIFKHLPPHKRPIISAVCKRWHKINKKPWRDVITLDISSIPCDSIGTYTKKCPNLRSVFGQDAAYDNGDDLHVLSDVKLCSLKLYHCSSTLYEEGVFEDGDDHAFDLFKAMFSEGVSDASWDELVLHNLHLYVDVISCESCYGCEIVCTFPDSLKRLQLSGDLKIEFRGLGGIWEPSGENLFGLYVQNLTGLILSSLDIDCLVEKGIESAICRLTWMKNLVELCVRCNNEDGYKGLIFADLVDSMFDLPKLEVLFLGNIGLDSIENLTKLVTKHPTLRILVLTESVHLRGQETIPARRLYPNGFGSEPLPLLHVFLGNEAAEKIRFEESPSDAIKIHQITEPLPKFLEKEEIAPIFDGVWIAAQIKEGAKLGVELLYDDDYDGSESSSDYA